MAYDEALATRLRAALGAVPDVQEKEMFGGLAILVGGHMACGIVRDNLMVRIGPDAYADALAKPHVRAMDFTGGPLKGMVYVDAPAIRSDGDLQDWVDHGVRFARSLPAKDAKEAPATKREKSPSRRAQQ